MATENGHKEAARFDFRESRHTRVFVCQRVVEGAPVLFVSHEDDGDWQFLCGGQHTDPEVDPASLACLECTVAIDPSLNDVADLHLCESASRERLGATWERHDEMEENIRSIVAEHGWFVAKIAAGETENDPAFAYTIGLHKSFGHPELIILGLRLDVMHSLLNICGKRIKAGEKLPIDQPIADLLDDYEVRLREVRSAESYDNHVGYAKWFNGGSKFRLLQLVWPDKEGRFPGERGVASFMNKQQPLLP